MHFCIGSDFGVTGADVRVGNCKYLLNQQTLIIDFAVLEERLKKEEMEVKLINEGIWKLTVEFNKNGCVDEIKVSEHYFNRIGRDFLSLEYYTPLYKFFNKKSIVQDFLMYNEFATTITKESDPVR